MNIQFLRRIDRWLGPVLLALAAPFAWALAALLPGKPAARNRVFLKLKGGGSLIIALPALLALRRLEPEASFTLVCTQDVKIYAELTGLFDRYCVIADAGLPALARSAWAALKGCYRADTCVDLEPNSILAALFGVLTLARRRAGFVKPEESWRAVAYTDALSFNILAPVHIYYDQMAELLVQRHYEMTSAQEREGIPRRFFQPPVSIDECRSQLLRQVRQRDRGAATAPALGLAPFTSDFARERMMPLETWIELLKPRAGSAAVQFLLFGSARNIAASRAFAAGLQRAFPEAEIVNLCGQGNLADAAADLLNLDEFWAIDSGLLHIARLLGVPCRSFWGPTNPAQRLRPMPGLDEKIFYHGFLCSPCAHLHDPPCRGDNRCMKTLPDPSPDTAPAWRV